MKQYIPNIITAVVSITALILGFLQSNRVIKSTKENLERQLKHQYETTVERERINQIRIAISELLRHYTLFKRNEAKEDNWFNSLDNYHKLGFLLNFHNKEENTLYEYCNFIFSKDITLNDFDEFTQIIRATFFKIFNQAI